MKTLKESLCQVEPLYFLATIDREKKALPFPMFLCSCAKDVSSRGQSYTAFPFSLQPTLQDASLFEVEIIAMTRDIVDFIKKSDGLDVRLEIFGESNPDEVTDPIDGRLIFDDIAGLFFSANLQRRVKP